MGIYVVGRQVLLISNHLLAYLFLTYIMDIRAIRAIHLSCYSYRSFFFLLFISSSTYLTFSIIHITYHLSYR